MGFIANLLEQFKGHRPAPSATVAASPQHVSPPANRAAGIHEVMGRPHMNIQTLARANDLAAMETAGRIAAEALGITVAINPHGPGFVTRHASQQSQVDWRLMHSGRTEREVYAGLGIDAMRVATCSNDAGTMRFITQRAVNLLEASLPQRIEQYEAPALRELIEDREALTRRLQP